MFNKLKDIWRNTWENISLNDNFLKKINEWISHSTTYYNCTKEEIDIVKYVLWIKWDDCDMKKMHKVINVKFIKNWWWVFNSKLKEIDFPKKDIDKYQFLNQMVNTKNFWITISPELSEKNFKNTLIHEIDHLIFYIIYILRNYKTVTGFFDDYYDFDNDWNMNLFWFKTEFFARLNSANATMYENDHEWSDTWHSTWWMYFQNENWEYAESTKMATNILNYRNNIYNLCAYEYWIDENKPVNFQLSINWNYIFQTFWSEMKKFLLKASFDEIYWFQFLLKAMSNKFILMKKWKSNWLKDAFNIFFNADKVNSEEIKFLSKLDNFKNFQKEMELVKNIIS